MTTEPNYTDALPRRTGEAGMKDKLRELAEWWKSAGCRNGSSHECADELLAILDAEGDGGAVAWQDKVNEIANNIGESLNAGCDQDAVDRINVYVDELFALTTHPARSGVVSDEDVSVVAKMIADRIGNGMREKYEELAKQIAEHFAAIAQEKQS